MRIKITYDGGVEYGYPEGTILHAERLINDYIDTLNANEDVDTIDFLVHADTQRAVDFVANMWGLDYEVID